MPTAPRRASVLCGLRGLCLDRRDRLSPSRTRHQFDSGTSASPVRPEYCCAANDSERRVARVSREIASKAPEIAAGRQRSRDLRKSPTNRDRSDFPRRLACGAPRNLRGERRSRIPAAFLRWGQRRTGAQRDSAASALIDVIGCHPSRTRHLSSERCRELVPQTRPRSPSAAGASGIVRCFRASRRRVPGSTRARTGIDDPDRDSRLSRSPARAMRERPD
jgi:hypothetical protein